MPRREPVQLTVQVTKSSGQSPGDVTAGSHRDYRTQDHPDASAARHLHHAEPGKRWALEQVAGAVARERLSDAIEAFELAERQEREIEAD